MAEIDLMAKYPRTKRNVAERGDEKTDEDKRIAKRFDKEFFDGDRRHGYGGFRYHPRFWTEVVKDMISYYHLMPGSKVLDVGCGKGFMLYDFLQAMPGLDVEGIDISSYAIENAMDEVKRSVFVGDAQDLGRYKDDEFDLVISINTVHNLPRPLCIKAIQEIERVGKHAFIVVDAWTNDEEKVRMHQWNLTAETFMHVDDWKKLFREAGYTGDYYWFIP